MRTLEWDEKVVYELTYGLVDKKTGNWKPFTFKTQNVNTAIDVVACLSHCHFRCVLESKIVKKKQVETDCGAGCCTFMEYK